MAKLAWLPLRGPYKRKYPDAKGIIPSKTLRALPQLWQVNTGKARLTKELMIEFQALIVKSACSVWTAADCLGVPRQIVRMWTEKGQNFEDNLITGDELLEREEIYWNFLRLTRQAESNVGITRGQQLLKRKFDPNWKRDLEVSARRAKRDWGKEDHREEETVPPLPDHAYL